MSKVVHSVYVWHSGLTTLEEFAGPECDACYIASWEESDVEVEPTDQGDRI